MTWIKPSFGWVLYRSGYGQKSNQCQILKVKISHAAAAVLLSNCECKHGGGGSKGRVQWDPDRDLMAAEGREPRKMVRTRAIQIGLSEELSAFYVSSILKIENVTDLADKVYFAHQGFDRKKNNKTKAGDGENFMNEGEFTRFWMEKLRSDNELPNEQPYMPCCLDEALMKLCMVARPLE